MPQFLEVGASERTPAKHAVLEAMVGREIGSAPYVVRDLQRRGLAISDYDGHMIVDLTAGDAVVKPGETFRKNCSPGIFAHLATTRPKLQVLLYERDANVFGRLVVNLARELPEMGFEQIDAHRFVHRVMRSTVLAIFGDGRNAQFDLRPGEWLFVNNDPNHMNDYVLNHEKFAHVLNSGGQHFATFMSTMGCNVGGMKRLSPEERRAWDVHVGSAKASIRNRSHLDLLMFEVQHDASQWAYLLMVPTKWIEKSIDIFTKCFNKMGLDVLPASYRRDPAAFDAMQVRLFRTRKERGL
jgi:hypothetical protein